jgi:hypothetical protein
LLLSSGVPTHLERVSRILLGEANRMEGQSVAFYLAS